MRTNIVLDEELVARALRFGEARTKRELVQLALTEYVQRRESCDLMDLFGAGGIRDDYDYKAARTDDRETDTSG